MTKIFKMKKKTVTLNLPPTQQQPVILTITPQSQLWVRDMEKLSVAFSRA